MEDTSNNPQNPTNANGNSGSRKPFLITAAILIPVVVAGYLLFGGSNQVSAPTTTEPSTDSDPLTNSTSTEQLTINNTSSTNYKDGIYLVKGSYVSPGGPEEIPVSITLKDDIIVASSMILSATNPGTKNFQTIFQNNFQTFVVGKNIDEVKLTKVSGSSLTPKGFNDAITKVKVQAKS